MYTTRKSININKNTKEIFPSVNFRGILPTEIFPRYIPKELQWEKIKTKQKNNDVSFLPTKLPTDKKLPMKDSPTEHFHR
jgi:predicted YcjX-like family ATPase